MARAVVILGPTAVGKSRLAMGLAEDGETEIVNADALQAYRGFDVGTAKPSADERRRVPHHLIDILEPHERYSAGEFARRARRVLADVEQRGHRAVVVGGSGLYLRALLEGISPLPPSDAALRSRLESRLGSEGLPALYAELERRDPETARRLAPGDRQRILRALEVTLSTGRPLSAWIAERPFGERRLAVTRVGLTLPRDLLYDRIAVRVRSMVQNGWVEEVERLLERGLDPSLPAFQAIGYRELVRYARRQCTLDEALEEIVRATRRFAKRQLTWYRKEPDVTWFEAQDPAQTLTSVRAFLAGARRREPDGQAEH